MNTKNDYLKNEWIVSNGIGGYASSTVSGANTRRYHGLLVAAQNPPVDRKVLVSKVAETIVSNKDDFELDSNFYPGTIYPEGYKTIESFDRTLLPITHYEVANYRLSKTVFMVHASNATVLEYANEGTETINLLLTPLFVNRNYHSLYKQKDNFWFNMDLYDNTLKINAYEHTEPVFMKFSDGIFIRNHYWHINNEYPREQERGQDFQEDSFAVGTVEVNLKPSEKVFLLFSTAEDKLNIDPQKLKQQALNRLKSLQPKGSKNQFLKDLTVAADQFVVWRKSTNSYSIIAGYHWFTDWGRDTMIALQGLGIALGKKEVSKSILTTFFDSIDEGMLPNRFSDNEQDKPEYNTIDASLWLFETLYKYYQTFSDREFIEENFYLLEEILKLHFSGTRYNIHLEERGFLTGGFQNSQLTWMDARINDYVVTPRHGMPVEIQALWYNALKIYLFFAHELRKEPTIFDTKIQKTVLKLKKNFKTAFWNENGYLNDVIGIEGTIDTSIRPNQLYALSLSFPILDKQWGKELLKTVDKFLYTPYGLRTLSPEDANFKSVYNGNVWERDTAYHQGTVWPFLLADYFQALKYVKTPEGEFNEKLQTALQTLKSHFYNEGCLHGIAEIFDGGYPEIGKGTVQQAWSVSALLQLVLKY